MPLGTPRIWTPVFRQVAPSSSVTCTLPSSVDAQISPGWSGLGAIERIVVWFSAPVASRVSPPLSSCRCFSASFVVRSGEIISQLSP